MFWKKETNRLNGLKTAFTLLFRTDEEPAREMFEFHSRERRKWFRVRPSVEAPVLLRFDDRRCEVRDIGAAGLSFETDKLAVGEIRSAELELPGLDSPIRVPMEIISIDTRNVCHCSFKTIEEDAVEKIHQYVLRRQKEILRENKRTSGKKKKKAFQTGE